MKIAVLTLPLTVNYGGFLQCYALCKTLRAMGHDVQHINIQTTYRLPVYKMPYIYTKRIIQKLRGKKCLLFAEQHANKVNGIIQQHMARFIEDHIPSTSPFYNPKALEALNKESYDAFIVGSDQVWRPTNYLPTEVYFLSFLKNTSTRRIAYAASFGTDDIEYTKNDQKRCGQLIKLFSAISIREKSASNLIKNKYHWQCKEPEFVLDPTLLLTADDYKKLSQTVDAVSNQGNLFYYVLDMTADKHRTLEKIAQAKGLKPFTVFPKSTLPTDKTEDRIVPSLEKWLRGFQNAEYVFTDSFHGTVFAILFNKPFIVYGNNGRGMARFHSLLQLLKLENRLILNSKDLSPLLEYKIDWQTIDNIINEYKLKSIRFIKDNLK